jgi:uncharacterized tellurite resistance protein B-like protein
MAEYDRMLAGVSLERDELTEILAALVQLASVDGEFGDTEHQMILTLMEHYAPRPLGAEELRALLDRPVDTGRIAHPEAALLLCLMLAYADGTYSGPEGTFLSQLSAALGVAPERLEELHLAVRIKVFSAIAEAAIAASPTRSADDQPVIEEVRRALRLDEETAAREIAAVQRELSSRTISD